MKKNSVICFKINQLKNDIGGSELSPASKKDTLYIEWERGLIDQIMDNYTLTECLGSGDPTLGVPR